ncbi:MAG TPA: YbdD/YjiX family protein [Gemmatimonadaceae bacterium]|nr:YbdD/YjiX family protein [Gemmatimonadaceae bacterium]
MKQVLRALANALRVMVGAPRYDAYRAHIARHHPEISPLSRSEFERARLEERYSKPGAKCC